MEKPNLIRKYLYEHNISLKEFAKACGINYTTLSMYKNDKQVISRKNKVILEKKLGMNFDEDITK